MLATHSFAETCPFMMQRAILGGVSSPRETSIQETAVGLAHWTALRHKIP